MAATSKQFLAGLLLLICLAMCTFAMADGTPTDLDPVASLEPVPSASDARHTGSDWIVPVTTDQASVAFKWNEIAGAARYRILMVHDKDEIYSTSTIKVRWSADMSKLTIGSTYVLTVTAVDESGAAITSKTITVTLEKKSGSTATPTPAPTAPAEPGEPTDEPEPEPSEEPTPAPSSGPRPPSGGHGGWGGRFPGQGSGSGGGSGITPGKALTNSHADGTGDMSRYDVVTLALSDRPMQSLTADGKPLGVTLDDGESSFTAKQTNSKLCLTPVSSAAAWQISGMALHKLHRSGISVIVLTLDGEELLLDTQIPLSGQIYTTLRSLGFPDATFQWIVDADGLHCLVNDHRYLYQDGILMQEV